MEEANDTMRVKRCLLFIVIFYLLLTMGSCNGHGDGEPSIPTPIPILRADLTMNVCGNHVSCCPHTRYRSIDGSCNNRRNPGWGTAKTTYLRLLQNRYYDGIFQLPRADTGEDMPNARELSIELFKDKISYDLQLNLLGMQWGQVITHDMSLLASATGEVGKPFVCCVNGQLNDDHTNESCAPVTVPANDKIHKPGSCLKFVRAETDRHVGCVAKDKEANQLSVVTPFMDASLIYGNTEELTAELRSFSKGKLRTVTRHGQEWPPQAKNISNLCPLAESPKETCYFGGDTRMNQNPELTVLHILLLRYHNYIAEGLSEVNPQWDDERVFQEARRVLIAVYQNINYYEYLPLLLGKVYMLSNKLIYPRTRANMKEYIADYDESLVPGVINEHATAALRYFHSLIQGYLEKKFADRRDAGRLRLSDWYSRPAVLETNNTFQQLVLGFTVQPAARPSPYFTDEITEFLFRGKNKYGGDLRTDDIQRGRDMGLGGYVAARAACGLTVPRTFEDLRGIIPNHYIKLLRKYYRDVGSIDLTVGGSLERHVRGARAGPTFLCIMLAQFYRTRVTDRFWFESGGDRRTAFTPHQLASIRSVTMASILCHTSEVGTLQRKAFEVITANNLVVSCDELPTLNLNLWKDSKEHEKGRGSQCH